MMGRVIGSVLVVIFIFSTVGGSPPREIPSVMTLQQTEAYPAGESINEALPAETFGYPNPQRVLEREKPLGLTSDQKERIQSMLKDLRSQAQFFGRKIVTDELFLDNFFRKGETDFNTLYNVLERIGGWRMRLRLACLNAYVKTRVILSSDQLKKYHELQAAAPEEVSTK